MAEQIRDGKGRGYLLEISEKHKVQSNAVVQSDDAAVSEEDGLAFSVGTGPMFLDSTNTHMVVYLKNTDVNKNLYLWTITLSWNGGDINHNRALFWTWYLGTSAVPTARAVQIGAGPLNFTAGTIANLVAYKWDGTGEGMEVATVAEGGGSYLTQGRSVIELHGTAILGLNDAAVIAVTGEEVGKFTVAARIFFKDKIIVL